MKKSESKEELRRRYDSLDEIPGPWLDPNPVTRNHEYDWLAAAHYIIKTGKAWKDFTEEERKMFLRKCEG